MSKEIKVIIIAGARPNFMKVAPIIKCIRTRSSTAAQNGAQVSYKLVHTGQHYSANMADVFFEQFGLVPDLFLNIGAGSANVPRMAALQRAISRAAAPAAPMLPRS